MIIILWKFFITGTFCTINYEEMKNVIKKMTKTFKISFPEKIISDPRHFLYYAYIYTYVH